MKNLDVKVLLFELYIVVLVFINQDSVILDLVLIQTFTMVYRT